MGSRLVKQVLFVGVLLAGFGAQASPSTLAVADLTGHWVGKGKLQSTFGMNSDCSVIDVTIKQTNTDFVIQNYHSACGVDDSTWGPNTMHIQGNDVFEDDEKVGVINDTTIETAAPDGNVVYVFNMKKIVEPDGSLSVDCAYGTQNALGKVVILGKLSKQP
jgi:hypothetical protein